MLSKRNLKDYDKQIVKINFKNGSGFIAGKLLYSQNYWVIGGRTGYTYKYAVNIGGVALEIPLDVIKDFCVINYDALEKSQKLTEKANGRKLRNNGKIKKFVRPKARN